MLVGAACAALTVVAVPAAAASNQELVPSAASFGQPEDQSVAAFYQARADAPLWLRGDGSGAKALIEILYRAPLDGLSSGPMLATQAQVLMSRAQAGEAGAAAAADRLLSAAWVRYVEALQTPPAGMTYA